MSEDKLKVYVLTVILLLCIALAMFVIVSIIYLYRTRKPDNQEEVLEITRKIPQPISSMSYDNITEFIDKMIRFEITNTIIKNGLRDKTDEEMSVILDEHILTISENVYLNMSQDMHTVIEYYVTDEYVKNYIKDTTRIVLVASLI